MSGKRAIWIVAALLAVYAGLAWNSARNASPTYDEPLHLVAASVIKDRGDFRVNPEDPPLFQRWVGLAIGSGAVRGDYSAPEWEGMLARLPMHWDWVNAALYPRAGGVDFEGTVWRGRVMMVLVGVGLGASVGWLAWLLAGRGKTAAGYGGNAGGTPTSPEDDGRTLDEGGFIASRAGRPCHGWLASVIAAGMFAFDPTLIGHGAIVKNDLALGVAFALCAVSVVGLVRGVRWGWVALLAVAMAGGIATKFSGLLLPGLVGAALLTRALSSEAWWVLRRKVLSRVGRVGVVVGIGIVCALVSYAAVWGVYGFRYSIGPGGVVAPLSPEVGLIKTFLVREREPGVVPSQEKIAAQGVPVVVRAVVWADERQVMPNAWCKGFLYTYATTKLRTGYLLSELNEFGWWYYFPVAACLKWPLGTIGLVGVGVWWAVLEKRGTTEARRARRGEKMGRVRAEVLAVGVMVVGYVVVAMSGNMNIGVRHLIPVVGLVYALVAGVVAREVSGRWGVGRGGGQDANPAGVGRHRWVVGVLGALVVGETLWSADRCIAFFNVPGRMYGAERLLGDSNLDWGQDLPKLLAWQRAHPEVVLSGALFGSWTAEAFGLRYVPLEGTRFSWGAVAREIPPGVVAVSASWLQELFLVPSNRGAFAWFRGQRPREVLGGTIFLYDVPPPPSPAAAGEAGRGGGALGALLADG